LERIGTENVGIFYGSLEYYTAIWYILWQFLNVCGNLVYFFHSGVFYQEKSGNPANAISLFFCKSFMLSKFLATLSVIVDCCY
jgi:hypothetical protein